MRRKKRRMNTANQDNNLSKEQSLVYIRHGQETKIKSYWEALQWG